MEKDTDEILTGMYREVCNSYHAIAGFRAKLLGFLPLASGSAIFLLLDGGLTGHALKVSFPGDFLAIGLFGFTVTIGLYCYELRGIQRCNGLIAAGKSLESELRSRGQFSCRPPKIAGFIGATLAAAIIYPAVMAAWTYLAFYPTGGLAAILASIVFIAGLGGTLALKLKPGQPQKPPGDIP